MLKKTSENKRGKEVEEKTNEEEGKRKINERRK